MPAGLHIAPLFALFSWVGIALVFFYRFPARNAILLTFIAGWAVLPTANFTATNSDFPYWILGVGLPAAYFWTKGTITGLAALAGVALFDPRELSRFRPSVWDLPMGMWCVAPFLSGIANHSAYPGALRDGLRGTVYQILAWAVPYLLGRLYFSDGSSMRLAAKAFVIAGLCYVPVCLIEIVTGPQFYAHVYGYQPYRWLGAKRYLGFRPIGFLEDGNQLGIWMASASLLAAGLWKDGRVKRICGAPLGWAATLLIAVTVLCQSGGSIVLLFCLLPLVFLSRASLRRGLVVVLASVVVCFAGFRLTNVVSLRWMVNHDRVARDVAVFFAKIGRQSFGWRLEQDERHVRTALARPLLGWGRWDWWRNGENRPWGMWLLAYGMYGGVGLVALEAAQLLPVAAGLPKTREGPAEEDAFSDAAETDADLRLAMAAVILLAAIDNLLNSGMILPLGLVIGGMSARRPGRHAMPEVDATIGG